MSENPDYQLDNLSISGEAPAISEITYPDSPGLGGDSGLATLLESLNSRDSFRREASAKALGQLNDEEAISALADTLHYDSDSKVRMTAATSLGMVGGTFAIRTLVEVMLTDSQMLVRLASAEGIRSAVHDLVDQSLRDEVVDGLNQGLADSSNFVRLMVCRTLGNIGMDYPGDAETIIPALAHSLAQDMDDAIRKEAVWALGKNP